MGLEQARVLGEILAVARVLDRRFFQFRGAAPQPQTFASPGADPGTDLIGAELRIRFPAVMPTGDFLHHLRGRWLVKVDQRVGCCIGLVDIAGLQEGRLLIAVTGAAALLADHIVPDIDLESGDVSIAWCRAVVVDVVVAAPIVNVRGGVGAAAAAATAADQRGQESADKW